jgi:hypothetical protein
MKERGRGTHLGISKLPPSAPCLDRREITLTQSSSCRVYCLVLPSCVAVSGTTPACTPLIYSRIAAPV